jgi:hypothetical protein
MGGTSASGSGLFSPGKENCTHYTGGWVGRMAGLDGCGKSRPHRDLMTEPFVINHAVNSYLQKLILVNIVVL